MFTNSKKLKKGSNSSGFKGVISHPLKCLSCQRRCFIVAGLILFALIYLNFTDSPVKGKIDSSARINGQAAIEETLNSAFGEGVMGGPIEAGGFTIAEAQAAYDFTSDDAQEDADFAILEGSGLISQDSPVPPGADLFGGMRRDVTNYVVQDGDTPFDIAIKFSINTYTVLWANNLHDGSIIRPGDQLLILPINGVRIKVGATDTVAYLAKKYKGKAEEIISFNNLAPEGGLEAGSFIIIPDGETLTAAPPPKVTAPKYAQGLATIDWLIIPTTGYDWGRIHSSNGVDIANVCGTPIYAAAAGKIILSDGIGWNGGYGKYIKIQHANGVVTLYGHASQLVAQAGEEVSQGQLIAIMGTTGRSTGCHLHFEVRGGKNPLAGKARIIN